MYQVKRLTEAVDKKWGVFKTFGDVSPLFIISFDLRTSAAEYAEFCNKQEASSKGG